MLQFETDSLCKSYRSASGIDVTALDGVSLAIERGSIAVVTGPSGSGKTTLLALLGALERPTAGSVRFDGRDLTRASDVELARTRRRLGFVFQDFSLIPNLTVEENITYPLIPRGIARMERRRRAAELLGRFGMIEKLAVRARELSGGEQQRVAIARALAGDPEALLADEPTSNLDVETTELLIQAFREAHAAGKTLVLASHDPRLLALATAVFPLAKGRIVTPEEQE